MGEIRLQAAPQAVAEQEHDAGERQGCDQRHRLQCAKAAGRHEDGCCQTKKAGPEQALPDGRVRVALSRNVVDDKGSGIGRCDEKHADQQHGQSCSEVRSRQEIEKAEKEGVDIAGRFEQRGFTAVHGQPDGAVAEHGHPQQIEGSRHEEHAEYEFTQRAAPRYARNKQPDKG